MTEGQSPTRWNMAVIHNGGSVRISLPRVYVGGEIHLTDTNVRKVLPNMTPLPEPLREFITQLFTICAVGFVLIVDDQIYFSPPSRHPTTDIWLHGPQRWELLRQGFASITGRQLYDFWPQEMLDVGNDEVSLGTVGMQMMQIVYEFCDASLNELE